MSLLRVQTYLKSLGFDPGPLDGVWGRETEGAVMAALERVSSPGIRANSVVPLEWMPDVQMDRVIVHWTAGTSVASEGDRAHYHILINGDGGLVRGVPSISQNSGILRPGYAAHTLNCNTGSIGVALCGMLGAIETPFDAGRCPITERQWDILILALAEICERYDVTVGPKTLLTHAEVQKTLGITQRGKWDISALPFDPAFPRSAEAVGGLMRRQTVEQMIERAMPGSFSTAATLSAAPAA